MSGRSVGLENGEVKLFRFIGNCSEIYLHSSYSEDKCIGTILEFDQ